MRSSGRCALFAFIGGFSFVIHNSCHATQIVGLGGKCLDVNGGRTANGTTVEIWPCKAAAPNQRWSLTDGKIVGTGGKCLDVDGGHTTNGTRVQMWDCNLGGANQRWTYYNGQLIGIDDKCLDVAGGNTDNGTIVLLWDCHGGPNQRWSLLPSVIAP